MNKLARLFQLNSQSRARRPVKAEVQGNEATIYIYGVIGDDLFEDGVTARQFADEVNGLEAQTIHLRINSPGGDVFEGRAMQQALRESNARVIAHVDGLAASAATMLTSASDEVEMAPGGFMMIHNAWSIAIGNASDFLDMASWLEKIDGSIRAEYAQKTGKSVEDVQALMDAETWMTADEAVAEGFADRVYEAGKKDSEGKDAAAAWDLSIYTNAPAMDEAADGASAASVKSFNREFYQNKARLFELGA